MARRGFAGLRRTGQPALFGLLRAMAEAGAAAPALFLLAAAAQIAATVVLMSGTRRSRA